jgi:NAD(P)-dependent dehydrogenase (short-subunit alcohol dehydrogenase family)
LVTVANGGIERAFVQELLKRGAAKIYLDVRDPDPAGLQARMSTIVHTID